MEKNMRFEDKSIYMDAFAKLFHPNDWVETLAQYDKRQLLPIYRSSSIISF